MKKFLTILILITVFGVNGSLGQTATTPQNLPPSGHYQIVMSTFSGRDVFMIDTDTGRIWQLEEFSNLAGQPNAWVIMPILTTSDDFTNFFRANAPSPPSK